MANRYQQLVDVASRFRAQMHKGDAALQRLLNAHERYSNTPTEEHPDWKDRPEVIAEIERLGTVAQITSLQNTLKAAMAKAEAALAVWSGDNDDATI